MGSRKGIIHAAIERLDSLMAIGESRRDAKQQLRATTGAQWSISTGGIHAHNTRKGYQQHVLAFINWTREQHQIRRLDHLDARADELATRYLQQRKDQGKSPSTLQGVRAALRLFFGNRHLAEAVALPRREREKITRSRGPKAHDRHLQPANWQPLITFLQATGLRRSEVRDLRIRDISYGHDGALRVFVTNGKGGRERELPVLPGKEQAVINAIADRNPDERVFARIAKNLDIHNLRRTYAQALYLHYAPGWTLPPATGRLKRDSYNREAVARVSQALGHNRLDVVLRHYLR